MVYTSVYAFMREQTYHTFHIPVLGLGYSIDTPLKVARYGISSVVSIIEDELIEDMRHYHAQKSGLEYAPIGKKVYDYRAKRITAYLDLLQNLVDQQINKLRGSKFESNPDLVKYFELLPSFSPLRLEFDKMMGMESGPTRTVLENKLKDSIISGSIDVNIMAKVDNPAFDKNGEKLPEEYSDALSALRGFAQSKLSSAVVLSAGYNPRLYNYIENFEDFFPDEGGHLRKKLILKVSDYRSAYIQGKLLAKKGLWVSEFRIESGINCGGHVFPTEGVLLGPILDEFRENRGKLKEELASLCASALKAKGISIAQDALQQKVTAQGGVGTAEEHTFLLEHFKLDGVGWGSPFLLVPEATNVDENTLIQLSTAKKEDFFLSNASPLGVPFHNFRKSSSENQRMSRVEQGRSGSPCYKKYLSSNTEFTATPICTASRQYQSLKENEILSSIIDAELVENKLNKLHEKDCLCEGLGAPVRLKNKMPLSHKLSAVVVCPGPNLAYFSGTFTLRKMVDHIYGRISLLNSEFRSHMFVNELRLYIAYFMEQVNRFKTGTDKEAKAHRRFADNLLNGICYYRSIANLLSGAEPIDCELNQLERQLLTLPQLT